MAKILVVDDDFRMVQDIRDRFAQEGYIVEIATCGRDALQLLSSFSYDVVLLDWKMPDITGLEVCQQFRQKGGLSYVIFVTGQGDIVDKELGFSAGCDDYLVKPFDLKELSLRIRTVLRRPKELLPLETVIDGVMLNAHNRSVTADSKVVQLQPKEFLILGYLMRHPDVPYTAQNLLDAIWPSDSAASPFTVRTAMMTLRKKLASIGLDDFVKTKPSLGYAVEQKKFDANASRQQ